MRDRGIGGGDGVSRGNKIVNFGRVIMGRVGVTRKGYRRAKGIHCRGGTICKGGADQSMGTEVRVGTDEFVQRGV